MATITEFATILRDAVLRTAPQDEEGSYFFGAGNRTFNPTVIQFAFSPPILRP